MNKKLKAGLLFFGYLVVMCCIGAVVVLSKSDDWLDDTDIDFIKWETGYWNDNMVSGSAVYRCENCGDCAEFKRVMYTARVMACRGKRDFKYVVTDAKVVTYDGAGYPEDYECRLKWGCVGEKNKQPDCVGHLRWGEDALGQRVKVPVASAAPTVLNYVVEPGLMEMPCKCGTDQCVCEHYRCTAGNACLDYHRNQDGLLTVENCRPKGER